MSMELNPTVLCRVGGVGSTACSVRTEGVGRNEVRTQGEASPSKNKKIVLLV